MAYIPVSSARIPTSLASTITLNNIQGTQRELMIEQERLSSGKQIPAPSYDPFGSAVTMSLQKLIERKDQAITNVESGRTYLEATDSALSDLNSLIVEAQQVASSNIGVTTTEEEREASAQLIEALIDQRISVGNRLFAGRYLFGGQESDQVPFQEALGGCYYAGDDEYIYTTVDLGESYATNAPGSVVFGAVSAEVQGSVDLDPQLTVETKLADLNGGQGISRGSIMINDGTTELTIDLSTADNIQDVIDLIESNGPAGITVSINPGGDGLMLSKAGADLTVTEVGAGTTARDLGILQETGAGPTLVGGDLDRTVSELTQLADLNAGAGIDLASGLLITNGGKSEVIDLSGAQTVQDLLNEINGAGLYVQATINDDQTGIDVINLVSGIAMTIGENGGTTATDLGVRSMHEDTTLAELNSGRGVRTVEGSTDMQVTRRDGIQFEIDLSSAETLQDVIDAINGSPDNTGGLLTAAMAPTGNGIQLVDASVGTGDLRVDAINASMAAVDLGLAQVIANPGDTLTQEDVNPIRSSGLLTGLMDLRDGLLEGDTQQITWAAEQLDEINSVMVATRAEIGMNVQAMELRQTRLEDELIDLNSTLSEVYDLDYAASVTNYQLLQNAYQASLQSAQTILQTSLLDYL